MRSPRRPGGRIEDSRIAGLIPGVANQQARRVYDTRVGRLRRAAAEGDEIGLGEQLCDAILLGFWRARSVTGFEALAHDVVGIEPERAWALAEQSATERGLSLERMPDIAVAVWLRTECALIESCPEAAVEVRVDGERLHVALALPIAPPAMVADGLAAVGKNAESLSRVFQGEAPSTTLNRQGSRR